MKTIFLDMDGVVADFAYQACVIGVTEVNTNIHLKTIIEHINNGNRRFSPHIDDDKLFDAIDARGMHFWANLPEMRARFKNLLSCVDLYNLCASVAPTYFLTAATAQSGRNSANVVGGKIHWLKDRFGDRFNNYIICERKAKMLLAQPGRILIDDHPKNVAEFTAAGGIGYAYTNELNLAELKAVIGAPL